MAALLLAPNRLMARAELSPLTSVKDKGGTGLPSPPAHPSSFLPFPWTEKGRWQSGNSRGPSSSEELAFTAPQPLASLRGTKADPGEASPSFTTAAVTV